MQVDHAARRAPLQERKQLKRKADGADADDSLPEPDTTAARVDTAAPEPGVKDRPRKRRQSGPDAAAAAAAAAEKHKWVRTVALGGLASGSHAAALRAARAAGGLQAVLDPPPAAVAAGAHLEQDGCKGGCIFLVYASVRHQPA